MMNLKRLSKAIAHALRHAPEAYSLTLDEAGWVEVETLVAGLRGKSRWRDVTLADVEAVLAIPGKKRYELQNGRIRAFYGHSVPTKISAKPGLPPAVLYHGTAPETAVLILQEGLKPMSRQYVHLSGDVETAVAVGKRKAPQPTILQVQAQTAHEAGIIFYESNDAVWLAEFVPPQFIEV